MDVALAQDHIFLALELDLETILRIEEHLISDLDRSNVRADGHRLSPRQSLGHLGGGGDQDPRPRPSFALSVAHLDEDPIEQHRHRHIVSSGQSISRHAVTVSQRPATSVRLRRGGL